MSTLLINPLEEILRLCAAEAPAPWYPRSRALNPGTDFQALGDTLEQLWLEGLIRKADQCPERGLGFTLTPMGERVLSDPQALQRLRDGLPLLENDTGSRIRHVLRHPPRPVVSVVLLVANFLVFGYGLFLAFGHGGASIKIFLSGGLLGGQNQTLFDILHKSGSVSGLDIARGEWWRLLTSAFCHLGLLHIGMNMYMLWGAGTAIEQRWGWWRYLLIYLAGAWGGGCLAMAMTPSTYVGASGALCGLLGAELIWVFLTGRHLPRTMVRQGRSQIMSTIVMLVLISLMPGVSGWGHLGGGIGGALAALILHAQRFGSPLVHRLGWIALLPLPWLGWMNLEVSRGRSPAWQRVAGVARQRAAVEEAREQETQVHRFEDEFLPQISRTTRKAFTRFTSQIEPVVDRHPTRREPKEVESALAGLPELRQELHNLGERLAGAGPYPNEDVETARTTALAYVQALNELLAVSETTLRDNAPWKTGQSMEVLSQRKAWLNLLE